MPSQFDPEQLKQLLAQVQGGAPIPPPSTIANVTPQNPLVTQQSAQLANMGTSSPQPQVNAANAFSDLHQMTTAPMDPYSLDSTTKAQIAELQKKQEQSQKQLAGDVGQQRSMYEAMKTQAPQEDKSALISMFYRHAGDQVPPEAAKAAIEAAKPEDFRGKLQDQLKNVISSQDKLTDDQMAQLKSTLAQKFQQNALKATTAAAKQDWMMNSKINDKFSLGSASARAALGKSFAVAQTAEAPLALVSQYKNLNDIPPQQLTELSTSLASMISRGQVTDHQLEAIDPSFAGKDLANKAQYFLSQVHGAGGASFARNILQSINRERELALDQTANDLLTNYKGYKQAAKNNPEVLKTLEVLAAANEAHLGLEPGFFQRGIPRRTINFNEIKQRFGLAEGVPSPAASTGQASANPFPEGFK